MLILLYTSFTSHNNNKDPETLSKLGRLSQQQCCKLLKFLTKISQFIKFHSSLNVKEHEDGLSAVQYNKIDYPTPFSKGRQKRVWYYVGENIYSLCSKTLVLIAQFSPSFAVLQKD